MKLNVGELEIAPTSALLPLGLSYPPPPCHHHFAVLLLRSPTLPLIQGATVTSRTLALN